MDDEARLLGPEPTAAESTVGTPVAPSIDLPPWWTLPLAGLGLALFWSQRKKTAETEAEAMRVLGRTALGKDNAVVLLEVRDADGGWRRLLLGASGQGTQLITGLGHRGGFEAQLAELEALPEVPAFPVSRGAPSQPAAAPAPTHPAVPEPVAPKGIGPVRARAAALHGELGSAPGVHREPPPVRKPSRTAMEGMDLLDEVRRTKGRLGTRIQAYG